MEEHVGVVVGLVSAIIPKHLDVLAYERICKGLGGLTPKRA